MGVSWKAIINSQASIDFGWIELESSGQFIDVSSFTGCLTSQRDNTQINTYPRIKNIIKSIIENKSIIELFIRSNFLLDY